MLFSRAITAINLTFFLLACGGGQSTPPKSKDSWSAAPEFNDSVETSTANFATDSESEVEPTDTSSPLQEAVQRRIRRAYLLELHGCYMAHLGQCGSKCFSGEVTITFTLSKTGEATDISVSPQAPLGQCLSATASSFTFSKAVEKHPEEAGKTPRLQFTARFTN